MSAKDIKKEINRYTDRIERLYKMLGQEVYEKNKIEFKMKNTINFINRSKEALKHYEFELEQLQPKPVSTGVSNFMREEMGDEE